MHLTRNYLFERRLIECKKSSKISKNKPIDLDLSSKHVSSIDTNAFKDLEIKRLNLASNELSVLDNSVLYGLVRLKDLNLSCNKLTRLDPKLFSNLKRRHHRFSENLKNLVHHNHKNHKTPHLTQIDLKNNQLTSLEPETFHGLTNLESLSLKSNRLTHLDSNCFKDLINLKQIELSFNLLNSIDSKCLLGLINLRKVDFSRNNIRSLNTNLFNGLVNLEEINFSENKIETIDPTLFIGLQSLKSINLGHNKLTHLDSNLFNGLKSLEIINLEFNQLDLIDTFTFKNLNSLKEINIYNNQLTQINAKLFSGLTLLEYIYFSFNKISFIDAKSLRGLTSLKAIHLSFNQITTLDKKLFKGLTQLNEILLENNQLSHIDTRTLRGLFNLNKISLANNLISMIDSFVFMGLNIKHINLDENFLSNDCQFNLICNLPKNVVSVLKQKELNQSDGMPLNLNVFIDSMQRKEILMNRKLTQEIEKRKKLEEQFNSLSAQSSSLMFVRAKAQRCSLRSNMSDAYYDAIDKQLNEIDESQTDLLTTNTTPTNNNNNSAYLPDLIPSSLNNTHRLTDEIERIVQEHIKIDLIDDLNSNVWQLFHEEGEMKIYKRDLEQNGIVLDPLKAVHKVTGITAHELCKYFFDPDCRMEWEATLDSSKVIEKLNDDSLIFHQLVKRVWPSAQRDSCFWSHIRSFESSSSSSLSQRNNPKLNDSSLLKDWIVVNYSIEHEKAPLKDGLVRAQANIAMICSTEILNKKKLNDLSTLKRDEICCHITYVSQVNPGGWVPAKALRAVYKNVYPKFVKGFGMYVVDKTAKKPILF